MVNGINMAQCGFPRMPWMMNNNFGMNSLSSNDDIFSQYNMSTPFMGGGFGGGMGMFGGMGYGPGSEVMNMNQEQYLDYQERLENKQIDKQVRQTKRQKAAGNQLNAPEAALTRQSTILHKAIEKGDGAEIRAQYEKLLNLASCEVNSQNSLGIHNEKVPREELQAYAETFYQEKVGVGIMDDIQRNGDSPFVKGLKQGTGIGALITGNDDTEDLAESITGVKKTTGEKVQRFLGSLIFGGIGIASLLLLRGKKA